MGNQELRLISGVVADLVVHRVEEEFVRSAGQQAAGVGAEAGLAAAGLAGAAVGASIAATASGDSVGFFSCTVGGQAVNGRFSKASFKDGDQIEAVVVAQRSITLAVRRRSDHILWMAPHCSRGRIAHRRFSVLIFFWIAIGFPIFGLSTFLCWSYFADKLADVEGIQFFGAICLVMGVTAALHYAIRFYRQWLPIVKQAEAIFAALGYPDPSSVDLPRDHKRYCKANGIEWPYLTDGPWIYHYLDPQQMPASAKGGISQ